MNEVTIHTFGHLGIFKAIFQALAVLFDPTQTEFFVSSDGMGLGVGATLAAIIALIGSGFNWFDNQKFTPHTAIYGIALYSMFFVPKMNTVWLSDLYTGRTESVQNVPMGVAYLGYAFSTLTLSISEHFEEQYTTSGPISGLAFNSGLISNAGGPGQSFLSPLKVLGFFKRDTFNYFPDHIRYNVAAYFKDCLRKTQEDNPSATNGFNIDDMMQSGDPVTYMYNPVLTGDYWTFYTKPDNSILPIECKDLAADLGGNGAGSIKEMINDDRMMGRFSYTAMSMMNNMESMVSESNNTSQGYNEALNKTHQGLEAILGTTADAQKFMLGAIVRDMAKHGEAFTSLGDEALAEYVTTMTLAVQNSRHLQIIEGEEFLHWSMNAMAALQFLFYALSPIIGIMLVAKGANSFKYFGSYILFGFWVYSWLPVAIAINFWSVGGFMEAFDAQKSGLGGISPEQIDMLIQQGLDAVATGSNLLAMTPLITFALLSTGSAYAMTSLSQAATPQGGASKANDHLTPALSNNAPVSQNQSIGQQASAGSKVAMSTQARQALSQIGISSATTAGVVHSSSQQMMNAAGEKLSATKSKAMNAVHAAGYTKSSGFSASTAKANGVNVNDAYTSGFEAIGMKGITIGKDERAALNKSWGGGMQKMSNAAFKAAIAADTFNGTKAQWDESHGQRFVDAAVSGVSTSQTTTNSSGETSSTQQSLDVKNAVQDVTSAQTEYDKTKQYADTQKRDATEAHSQSQSVGATLDDFHTNAVRSGQLTNSSWGQGEGFFRKAFDSSATQAGLTSKQSDSLWDRYQSNANKQFQNDGRWSADDRNSATAFQSYWNATGSTSTNAKENAVLADTRIEALKMSGGSAMVNAPKSTNFKYGIDKNIGDGSAIVAKAGSEVASNKSDIKDAQNKQNSPHAIKKENMDNLSNSVGKLDSMSPAIFGSSKPSDHYQKSYEQNRNDIAQGEGYNAENFDALTPNQQRSVSQIAAQNTLRGFNNDVMDHVSNRAAAGGGNDLVAKLGDTLSGSGFVEDQSKATDKFRGVNMANRNSGEISQGDFETLNSRFNNHVDGLNSVLDGGSYHKQQVGDLKDRQAEINQQTADGKSKYDNLIHGKEGVPMNTMGSKIEDIYQGNDSDFNSTLPEVQRNNKLDEGFNDLLRRGQQQSDLSPDSFMGVDIPNSSPSSSISKAASTYEGHRENLSPTQAMAQTIYDEGASTSGMSSKVIAETSGIQGVGALVKEFGPGKLGKMVAGSSIKKPNTKDLSQKDAEKATSLYDKSVGALAKRVSALTDGVVDVATAGVAISAYVNNASNHENLIAQNDNAAKSQADKLVLSNVQRTASNVQDMNKDSPEKSIAMMHELEDTLGIERDTSYNIHPTTKNIDVNDEVFLPAMSANRDKSGEVFDTVNSYADKQK